MQIFELSLGKITLICKKDKSNLPHLVSTEYFEERFFYFSFFQLPTITGEKNIFLVNQMQHFWVCTCMSDYIHVLYISTLREIRGYNIQIINHGTNYIFTLKLMKGLKTKFPEIIGTLKSLKIFLLVNERAKSRI